MDLDRVRAMPECLAGWVFDRRWGCLAVGLLLTAGAVVPALQVPVDNSIQRWFVEGDPALKAYRSFQDTYGNDEMVLIALQREEGMLTPTGFQLLHRATEALRTVDGVASVQSLATVKRIQMGLAGPQAVPLVPDRRLSADQARALRRKVLHDSTLYRRFVNEDGTMTALLARMQPNEEIDGRRNVILDDIGEALDQVLRGTNVKRHQAGAGVILHALNEASTEDSRLAILMASLLAFVLLWGFFRRLYPVLLTLGVVGAATVWLMGAYGLAGLTINTVTLVMPSLVLVIGTANCVHLLRHAADLPDDLAPRDRVVQTVGFLLPPCGITTLTTALGFAALGVSAMPVVRHLGLFSALGIVFGFVASTVGCAWGLAYPSMLPVSSERGRLRALVTSVVEASLRRSWGVLATVALVVIGAGWGIAQISVDTDSIGYLYRDHPVRQDSRLIEREFGAYAPLEFIVRSDSTAPDSTTDLLTPKVFRAVQNWQRAAVRTGAVGWSYSAVDGIQRLHSAMAGHPQSLPNDPARLETLVRLAKEEIPYVDDLAAHPDQLRVTFGIPIQSANGIEKTIRTVTDVAQLPEGVRLQPTGYLPLYLRITTLVVQSQLWTFSLALGVILTVIGLLFRSVRAALLAFLPNVLPVLLTLGAMGWLGIPLDIATVTIAAILFGLVVDDSVHLLHRYMKWRAEGHDAVPAVRHAAQEGGPMLATTTCVITVGVLALTLAQVKPVVWFGGLTALGISLALAVDLTVLPALIARIEA